MVVAAFVAPFLMPATVRFVATAAQLPGVRLAVVTTAAAEQVPPDLARHLAGHWRVDDALDPQQIADAVRGLARQLGPVQRLIGALEQLQVPLAEVREALGIPGTDVGTARNVRDKARMKEVLHAAGIPCARHRLVTSPDDAFAFAAAVGFPLVAKPPAGAGAQATYRLDGPPPPLDVLRNPWIQWTVLLPRELDDPRYAAIRDVGPAAVAALGVRDGLTHMEWFRRPDGTRVELVENT